jgi:NRPS condensation-like uncharacterized protein
MKQNTDRYLLHPFDFFSDLLCSYSNQVIHMVIYPDCHVDHNILRQAIIKATILEPVTRCKIIKSDNMLWWEENSDLNEDDLVVRISSSHPEKHLHEALARHIDPYQDPLMHVVLIESEDPGTNDILVLNVHHVSMDGRGIKDMAGLILSQYLVIQSGKSEEIEPTSIKTRTLPLISSLVSLPGSLLDKPEVQISWSADFSIPVQYNIDERMSTSVLTMEPERMEIIQRTRKEWRVTFNDLMLAIITKACLYVSGKTEDQVISLLNTIDLRRYLKEKPARSISNYSTAFKVDIPVRFRNSLKDTASWVSRYMDCVKSKSPGLDGACEAERLYDLGHDSAIIEIFDRHRVNKNSGRQIPIYTNIGVIPKYSMYPGIPVSNAYVLPSHSSSPSFFFAISTYMDKVTISSTYYEPAFDRKLIERIYCLIDKTAPGYLDNPGVYTVI